MNQPMSIFEAAIKAVAELLGWTFFPETWEFGKVVLLEDRTTVSVSCTLDVEKIAIVKGKTKDQVEAEALYALLQELPLVLAEQEIKILRQVEDDMRDEEEES